MRINPVGKDFAIQCEVSDKNYEGKKSHVVDKIPPISIMETAVWVIFAISFTYILLHMTLLIRFFNNYYVHCSVTGCEHS